MEDIGNIIDSAELQQMQKLKEFRGLTTAILKRHALQFILIFILCCVAISFAFWKSAKNSPTLYLAQTNLIFYPKSTNGIKPLDDNQVMRILTKHTMILKVAEDLAIPDVKIFNLLGGVFDVQQDPRSHNLYVINAHASTDEEAIRRVNAYADAAMREYASYRREDLRARRETIERRMAEISTEFSNIDAEENALNTELGIASPIAEIERLSQAISNKKKLLAETQLQLVEADANLKDVKTRLGDANPAILDEADTVRRYTEKLTKCDEEIEKLAFVYTDENPKLALAREERRVISEQYNTFLAKYGMRDLSESDLKRIDDLGKQAKDILAEIDRLNTVVKAYNNEIVLEEEKLNKLLKYLPQYEGFKMRRTTLREALSTAETTYGDIRFLEATISSELSQLERCGSAIGTTIFSRKVIVAIISIGAILSGLFALLFFFAEIIWGRIHDEEELALYNDIVVVGSEGVSNAEDEEAFNKFRQAFGDGKKLYLAQLTGCKVKQGFFDRFLLKCSMAGLKTLLVDIVRARDFTPDEKDTLFTAISYREDRGKMPVVDPEVLSSMEIAMLKADLTMLLSDFNLVILKTEGTSCTSVISQQLSEICDARLALIRPRKTPRKRFRDFLETKAAKTMVMAVKHLSVIALMFLVASCYPNRLTRNYEQYPYLVDEQDTFVDENEMTEIQLEEQLAYLKALDEEPPETYRINAGDRVKVIVYDHPDLCTDATITPDGHLGIVFLGQVKVANLTLSEACEKIEQGLSKYIKKPALGITPLEISSQSCTIAGGIESPGVYPVSSDMRLADLYALAGGTAVRRINGDDMNIADMATSYIFRDGKALPVDFNKAITCGDRYHNVRLKKNDYVFIGTRSEAMVCVVGHVKTPRKILFDRSVGLIEVLTNAGWVDENYWPNVIIIRGGVTNPKLYRVDIDAILAGKCPNISLQAGDIVYVPHDDISEYNVFVRKLIPTSQLFNLLTAPFTFWHNTHN